MPFITVDDGTRIFVRVEGPAGAPALILSNSLGTDHMMWQPQADAMRGSMRVVRYDQRGHGASDVPGGAYTLDRLGQDVLAIADHLGLETFTFCGLSMGGLTGQWLGINAGNRIEKLVLADTAAQFPPPEMWDERMQLIRDGGMAAVAEGILERFFTDGFRQSDPRTTETFRQVILNMTAEGYLGCSHAVRDADVREAIAGIKIPTLVITGKHDPSTPPERGDFISGKIDRAEHVVLDAAHISNIEQPAAFTSALKAFVTGEHLPSDTGFTEGMARRRAVLGDTWVDRALARRSDFNADFQDLITRYAWGEIWTRPGLDETTRRLLVLAISASLSRWEEFELHARAAIAAEVSTDAVKEVLLQTAIYAGVPAANTAFQKYEALLSDA